jgi:dihydrofolate reductase
MRRVVYEVATSLDGFIAGPRGEYDWIPMDPDIDFGAMAARFDTVVMGRRSYEVAQRIEGGLVQGVASYVYSRTLPEGPRDGVTVVHDGLAHLRELKRQPGRDIWLWGGGELFRACAGEGLVDAVELGVIPILLGGGVPLLPTPGPRVPLRLRAHRVYTKTGTLMLEYDVVHDAGSATR